MFSNLLHLWSRSEYNNFIRCQVKIGQVRQQPLDTGANVVGPIMKTSWDQACHVPVRMLCSLSQYAVSCTSVTVRQLLWHVCNSDLHTYQNVGVVSAVVFLLVQQSNTNLHVESESVKNVYILDCWYVKHTRYLHTGIGAQYVFWCILAYNTCQCQTVSKDKWLCGGKFPESPSTLKFITAFTRTHISSLYWAMYPAPLLQQNLI
jgi:hypothetical protein